MCSICRTFFFSISEQIEKCLLTSQIHQTPLSASLGYVVRGVRTHGVGRNFFELRAAYKWYSAWPIGSPICEGGLSFESSIVGIAGF